MCQLLSEATWKKFTSLNCTHCCTVSAVCGSGKWLGAAVLYRQCVGVANGYVQLYCIGSVWEWQMVRCSCIVSAVCGSGKWLGAAAPKGRPKLRPQQRPLQAGKGRKFPRSIQLIMSDLFNIDSPNCEAETANRTLQTGSLTVPADLKT